MLQNLLQHNLSTIKLKENYREQVKDNDNVKQALEEERKQKKSLEDMYSKLLKSSEKEAENHKKNIDKSISENVQLILIFILFRKIYQDKHRNNKMIFQNCK